ncbi:hypothetical protein ElyMa_004989800 [Elysia marginata]|uniref:Uncharacterized protein n=1 Tax=Elysia marginata TaxID=1093978 RepID=A0AAV4J624_9GAST|nr:hypothetical protein ElyMa_004989800 [Elysia marginata]
MKQAEVSTDPHQVGEGDNDDGTEEEIARLQKEYERIQEQLKNLVDEDSDEDKEGAGQEPLAELLEGTEQPGSSEEQKEADQATVRALSPGQDGGLTDTATSGQDDNMDDGNEQELRRLALATSARHLRLLAAQTSVPIPELPSSKLDLGVVVIPDTETISPEPEIVTVDEEEEEEDNKENDGSDEVLVTGGSILSTFQGKAAKKTKSSNAAKSDLTREKKTKATKEGKEKNPVKKASKSTPHETSGKRQVNIPVLTDKPKSSGSEKQEIPQKPKQPTPKTGAKREAKPGLAERRSSGHTRDNYDQVEMDIDSDEDGR